MAKIRDGSKLRPSRPDAGTLIDSVFSVDEFRLHALRTAFLLNVIWTKSRAASLICSHAYAENAGGRSFQSNLNEQART